MARTPLDRYGRQALLIAAGVLLCWTLAPQLGAQRQSYRPSDIDAGAAVYAAHCFSCHSEGQGVVGVDLRSGPFRRATTDNELQSLILKGIPGTEMPPHALTTAELNGLVAY